MARARRKAPAGRRFAAPMTDLASSPFPSTMSGASRRGGGAAPPRTRRSGGPRPRRASHPVGGARRALNVLLVVALAGSTYGLTSAHKTVTIDDDGQIRHVSAYGRTVADILRFQGIETLRGDEITPSAAAPVHDGATIVVRSARQVTLEVDGHSTTFTTNALTVGDLISALGARGDGAVATASRSAPLGREPIRVSTQKKVTFAVDGVLLPVTTTRATVSDVLDDAGIALGENDATSVPLGAAAVDGMVVVVQRGSTGSATVTEVIPFETETVEEPALPQGYQKVRTTGRAGEAVTTYATRSLEGAEVERTVVSREVTREPRTEVTVVGTMDPATVVVTPGTAKATAQALLAERGWGDDQFACLDKLWTKESGWNVTAENSSSGAYGIPQALPGSKMGSVADDWRTNATTQIIWGLGYIAGRYGTPCEAWSHSLSTGWY